MYTRVANVWESSAESSAEAKSLELKAQFMNVLRELIHNKGWDQAKTAEVLGIAQPRVSYLINGSVSKFSMDKLYEFLTIFGYDFELSLQDGLPTITTIVSNNASCHSAE